MDEQNAQVGLELSERLASNERLFAEANDRIARVASKFAPRPLLPFLCECRDAACNRVVLLSPADYAAVRLFPRRYVVTRGCADRDGASALVLERGETHVVVDRIDA
jgi:hypothetical protein